MERSESRTASASGITATTVIRPTSGPIPPRLSELWGYRELFAFLVWRDIKVRYAQTALGAMWMFFQPLALMLVYTFAFSHLTQLSVSIGKPYPVFALSGLVLWIFVSRGVLLGAESLIMNLPLVTKTSCPRILLPTAAVTSVAADFFVTTALYIVFAAIYGTLPTWHVIFVPGIMVLALLLTLGLALLLSAMSVRYRDVAQALPFLIQLWFFLSPIAYLLQTPPGFSWQTAIQSINPIVGLVLAMRWALLDSPPPHGLFLISCAGTLIVFAIGVVRFAHAERTIADEL